MIGGWVAMGVVRGAHVAFLVATAAMFAPCQAQDPSAPRVWDFALQRAQRLAGDGDLVGARAITDSILAASPEGSAAFIEALFRRATFAASADEARRDYLKIAVEFSLAPRSEDALLRLAQMELARGDRVAAKRYLDRLAREHADGKLRAQGQYWMGRALLEEGALPQACVAFSEARARLLAMDVELGNQISYYSRQCETVAKAEERRAAPDSALGGETSRRTAPAVGIDSAVRGKVMAGRLPGRAAASRAVTGAAWSAQVAAYGVKAEAERVAQKLKARGLDARVTDEKPFRVRLGRFARREEAAALVERLRSQKIAAIVVQTERP